MKPFSILGVLAFVGLFSVFSSIARGLSNPATDDSDSKQANATVLLNFTDPQGQMGLCTGTLIKNDVVLTAGHCLPDSMRQRVTKPISQAVALAEGGRYLYFITSTRLHARERVFEPKTAVQPQYHVEWRDVGHAFNLTAMAGDDQNLYAYGGKKLWYRPVSLVEENWRVIQEEPSNRIYSLGAGGGKLYAMLADGKIIVRAAGTSPRAWEALGTVPSQSRGLAVVDDYIYTTQGLQQPSRLLRRRATSAAGWSDVGTIAVTGRMMIAGSRSALFAIGDGGYLIRRNPGVETTGNELCWENLYPILNPESAELWYPVRAGSQILVSVGNDRLAFVGTAQADKYRIAGNVDILALKLTAPTTLAAALPVMGALPPDIGLKDLKFRMVGWGFPAGAQQRRYRRQAPAEDGKVNISPCGVHNPAMLRVTNPDGVTVEGGDSGGPLYWTDPVSKFTFVAGVTQGTEASGGRHVMTFYRGGKDSDEIPLPDLSNWLLSVLR